MKRACLLLYLLAITTLVNAEPLRLSEPVSTSANSETFGAVINEALPKLGLSEAVDSGQWLGKDLLIEARVGQVCQKKGCFFMAMDGSLAVRVSFKDYSFFIPTDSGNKVVTLEGQLVERELTPEQIEHFKKDAGGELAIEAGKIVEIVATAVRIPT